MRFEEIVNGVLAGKEYRRFVDGDERVVLYRESFDCILFEWVDGEWDPDGLNHCAIPGDFTASDWEEFP